MRRVITSRDELHEVVKEPNSAVAAKDTDTIDRESRRFIEASPFFLLATTADDGSCDVSPRGDPPGNVLVLDEKTLAFADRKGNRRLDSMLNILERPQVGMLFIVPGVGDTLRVNGTASIVEGADYISRLAVRDSEPKLSIEVRVDELFLHCTKAFLRSSLWDAATWPERKAVPTAGQIARSQHGVKVPARVIDAALRLEAKHNQY
ncbi:MSMEG_1061 family FMN-dependent PPOX-type flavoprotein [Pseudonocardia sp. TRM90224]|uniref:MSMEG_1061 family FMN-dependent PPOX-type flavoprotein n=1 Tax=Pseudonocardia sp. TRM90224 TaxID=2812678 RepID=UPI001E3A9852|nr:MSMEG_1061 family FMN-dependent PPOX-type flavoprotein [Pseudonocardia sp. TRM90224]